MNSEPTDSSSPLKTVIIGSGPAGLTAAVYAARAGLNPVVVAGYEPGGQLTRTSKVENYPGFASGVMGPDLMNAMLQQAEKCGAKILYETADKIEAETRPFAVTLSNDEVLRAHTIIFATGSKARMPGVPGEKEYQPPLGAGITTCAVCDGAFYRGQDVCVLGGGDSAMEEATYLAKLCRTVTIVHRREGLRASKVMIERAKALPNVEWELNQVVDEILGDDKTKHVRGIRIKDVRDGRTRELAVTGVFVAIGHLPNTNLLQGIVELDKVGYVITDERQSTSVPGLFAAGDCHDHDYRQAVTAAAAGCKAALEVERLLTREGIS